jgi:hypothetical protein
MTRRVFISGVLAGPVVLNADAAADAWELVTALAAALAEDNASGFLDRMDKNMPGLDDLSRNVRAMLEQANVQSSVSPLANDGGDSARKVQLDWELRLKPKSLTNPLGTDLNSQGGARPLVEREEAVTLELRRDGKKWKVTKVDPIAFFSAANFR